MRRNAMLVLCGVVVAALASCGDDEGTTENRKAPVVTSFTASASTGIPAGSQIMLAWETQNADMVSIAERDASGDVATPFYNTQVTMSGALEYIVRKNTTLVLTAYNMGSGKDPAAHEIAVAIEPPVVTTRYIEMLQAVPGQVLPGDSVEVEYRIAGPQAGWRLVLGAVGGTVTIEHALEAAGSVDGKFTTAECGTGCPLTIGGYTVLGATLLDSAGATLDYRETGVGILSPAMPIVLQYEVDDALIVAGSTTTIRWNVANTTNMTITEAGVTRICIDGVCAGTVDVTPSSTTSYTLSATGLGGTRTEILTVEVSATPVPPTVDTFAATPAAIHAGTTSTLSWTTSLADTVVITAVPADASLPATFTADGSADVSPAATTTYTITATNGAGNDTDTETVTLTPLAAGDLVITEIMVNPLTFLDTDAEWFEVLNPGTMAINLSGLVVTSGSADYTIASDVVVAAGDYALLAISGNTALNDNLPTPDVIYGGIALDEPADDLSIADGATVLDEVVWDATWVFTEGLAWSLLPASLDAVSNDTLANWCGAGQLWIGSTLNFGTPGAAHVACD